MLQKVKVHDINKAFEKTKQGQKVGWQQVTTLMSKSRNGSLTLTFFTKHSQ